MLPNLKRRAIVALIGTVPLCPTAVQAASVGIVRPSPTPELTEAMTRLHGELLSIGLEVVIVEHGEVASADPNEWPAWLERASKDGHVDAIVAIEGEKTPVAVDVWVFGGPPQHVGAARVRLEPNASHAAERLAIRAVEVLRSTFLEHDMTAKARREESVVAPPRVALARKPPPKEPIREVAPPERLIAVELGAYATTSLDGVGPAVSPLLRLDVAARRWLVVEAALAGLGSQPSISAAEGNARVAQVFGTLGLAFRARPRHAFWPYAAMSAGVLHTKLTGAANAPARGHNVDQWSLLLDACLGSGLSFSDRYFSTLGLHVQSAVPYVAIHFVDSVVATTGHPNFALSLSLGAWL
jgi:hypothetical protein